MMDNELYHHGVLGMKWGVRKQRESTGGRSSRSRAIKRGALIAAGLLATGALAYGLYRTGAYQRGLNAAQRLLSDGKKFAKKKIIDTLDDPDKLNGIQYRAEAISQMKNAAKNQHAKRYQASKDIYEANRAAAKASRARYQASKDIYEANKAFRSRAEQTARKAANQKVSTIPKATKDAGKKRLSKLFSKINKRGARTNRAVNNFNSQNSRFINNLGNM